MSDSDKELRDDITELGYEVNKCLRVFKTKHPTV